MYRVKRASLLSVAKLVAVREMMQIWEALDASISDNTRDSRTGESDVSWENTNNRRPTFVTQTDNDIYYNLVGYSRSICMATREVRAGWS
jgi:hypothetical protein